ncbi:response regulator transcription factor [Sphingobium sp. B11D3A]|uniref:response regulator transcription factor n=1 Tax=Sphingobium sp. B11D3A TaxID=2940574 RepID=UPI0022249F0B|nr:response regulator transcription factor [Sphingobium sp. B11D3A]MCW2393537.1 two-component system torCAD operon response regulator TorR [Sphingobium sp. B11D3A]
MEDDQDLRVTLADYLNARGLDITEAMSGIGFYRALRSSAFDVAILDVNLPDASGFELAREIATKEGCGIIFLTARAEGNDRIEGYAAGADLYLTKPVEGEELFLAIQNLARRVSGGARSTVSTQPGHLACWWLDMTRGLLIAPSGRSFSLTGREIMLLQYFAEAGQGAIITRVALTELMGYDRLNPESRSLDAVLRRLRQKVHAAEVVLPLHAIHSVGFRFAAPLQIT